ncbi:restriction endonuclease subunit S [Methylophaga sp. SB9B]|uniref:restriction endonuclease subunit S n=1 Tax=Methylophaga sp. SB9B TaxID=2570356 RepID=UPI0010A9486E|nr:restriction endonuclease subunit S [Methylophaga sp. SB9B]THK41101.1 restriction endonuclease subunit S [Methylophaga sp. SB9B]
MKIKTSEIKTLLNALGFTRFDGDKDIYYKNYPSNDNYVLKVDFDEEKIDYGNKIKLGDLTTSNFESTENFVVLDCVDKLLVKGYPTQNLSLEHKWPMGRKEKGKLDVLVFDNDGKAYLMIECKTWGEEYDKEKKKMQRDGGQLFSYFQQDKAAQYLCLYASRIIENEVEFTNDIVKVDEAWKELDNQKEIFDHWNKNFKDNGIFEEWANAYDVEIKSLRRSRLKELTAEDSGRIYNQFAEILRHNVVSDKPNAFNKIFNLFLCKIVDEDRKPDEELKFQWLESDTNEDLQKRLSDLYKQGMKEYLTKEVTDYNDEQVEEKLYALDSTVRDQIREMFTRVRLHKNNEFAFKEVFDSKSFEENAVVVREVVELLQPYQIRYGHKQQFLGDFFELLLSTGIKQEAGQFFTPVPIAKFIISSLPLRELIKQNIENDEKHFLPYIIDYAAGSGHFLTESMDEVQNIINGIDESKQRPSVKRSLSSWKINPFDWAYDYVYGIEADYRLVKTAKVSCFLNGDGLANVIHADGLDHFQKSTDYKGKLKEVSKDDAKDNGIFDVLVANPPYSVSAFKNTLKNGEESFDLFNRLTDDSSEIECLFIERAKQLLKPGGWAGIILPSSILSNSGIYTDAREIILKYFTIKAIAEFGSNTFMATGTNTVSLFLERKNNNDWKKIESSIKNFFERPKEANVNGIEKAFSKYVDEVFEDITLGDYISLVNKKPTEAFSKTELFTDYQAWFNGLTEVKNLKKKKIFNDKTSEQKQIELDKLFYCKVFAKEQERMLYFFLAKPEQLVLIKVGEKQAEKDFIGYEFSNRRGHEGIKMYRDQDGKLTTKLYNDDNHLDEEKANSYVYSSFLGENREISESLQNNLTKFDLSELIDFKSVTFTKEISLGVKKKVRFQTKYDTERLSKLLIDLESGSRPKGGVGSFKTGIPSLGGEHVGTNGEVITDSLKYVPKSFYEKCTRGILKGSEILICKDGALTGKVALMPKPMPFDKAMINEHVFLLRANEKIEQLYLFHFLYSSIGQSLLKSNITGQAQGGLNSTNLNNLKIPLPPKDVQKKIIQEIEALDKKEKADREKLFDLNSNLDRLFLDLSHPTEKLGKLASFKNGLNYSEKSMGESVTIVGVKDFLEDFSPDLEKLVQVRIDGALSESYKLEAGDILVVRSNGSANLVGRFIYIKQLNRVTSYSGFTIRVRANSDKINSKYLCYCLRTDSVRNKITTDPKGANIKSVNQTMLSAIDVPLPPLKVQQQIIQRAEQIENEISQIESEATLRAEIKQQIFTLYLK